MASFNLTEKLWIPSVSLDGRHEALSLRHVFERANELREIVHLSPLVTVGIHRLLLAILHRCFDGPGCLDEWRKMWREGWETARLNAYLDSWRHRFDLFDSDRPFYQMPYMEDAVAHPITTLMQEAASGNNPTLFDHSIDDSPISVTSAEAACYLIARQAYSIGFGRSRPFDLSDSALVRGMTIKMVGENLFETLMLNLVRYNESAPIPRTGDDIPAWEREKAREPDRNGTIPAGYVDHLTWQSRRVHLIPKGSPPVVIGCQVQQNLKLHDSLFDPFKTYRKDEKKGWNPIGFNESKALWRDSHTLLREVDAGQSRRSDVINWAARINNLREQGDNSIRSKYILEAVGIATASGKAANVIFWRHERLPLPLDYLENKELAGSLEAALKLTEDMSRILYGVVRDMTKEVGGDGLADHLGADRAYWSRLEEPFKRLLVELPDDVDDDGEYGGNRISEWKKTVRDTLQAAFDEATRGMERSTRNLKAMAIAEQSLRRAMGKRLEATR